MSELKDWRGQVKSAQEILDATHPAIPGGTGKSLTAANKRITELEAENARLRVDAGRLSQYFSDEEDTYSAVGDYLDNAQPDIGDTFELTKCYAERKPTRFRVISRGLDITGEPIIDVEEVDEAKSHSANTVGGPTPVMDAAPACERKE